VVYDPPPRAVKESGRFGIPVENGAASHGQAPARPGGCPSSGTHSSSSLRRWSPSRATRLGLGSVLGYLVAGAVIGPSGLALAWNAAEVLHVAELGVVLLLFLIGLVLSQGGEFAFVLFGLAAQDRVLDPATADALVLVVALSMATTPALYALHARLVRPRLGRLAARAFDDLGAAGEPPVIIAGFGRVGQVVGRVLRAKRIPFTALDASSEHIEFIRRFGNRVFFGDASRLDLLRAARADHARIFVLEALGLDREDAAAAGDRFRAHDEALLEASWQDQDDEAKLRDVTSRGRDELERLFEEDAAARRRPA
jgi:hypothetical protein